MAFVAAAQAPANGAADRRLHGNNFFSNCGFSHVADDDPIVYPGRPGWSHSHAFFGNTSTRARSTLKSLRRAGTTCRPRADTAAYWVPTLYRRGREIRPAKGQFYYVVRGRGEMHAFPPGLRIVAGDSHAVRPQSPRVAYWACGGRGGVRSAPSATAPNCGVVVRKRFVVRTQTYLELHVNFPDCWDGEHLDSRDHRSHMAYSRNYACPASHPVKVPLIRLMIRYPITRGRGVVLASGGELTGHADFFNAWDQRALARLVDDCFHGRPCNEPRTR